jgi:6-phosphogluconolactonase
MSDPRQVRVEVLPDAESLARAVADWLLAEAVGKQGPFAISLSGGSTPRLLYVLLAKPPYLERFPWPLVHWFWGDERFVPHSDAKSNYRMVAEVLLSQAPIPDANIHAVPTAGNDPHEAAAAYERGLKAFYGAERLDPARPLFDVTLLGLGTDGHTAIGAMPESRITLTFPALSSSRHAAFLIAGADKRPMLERLRRADDSLPAARVHPVGALHIFCDADAAGL